jgi:hypothetical protein
MKINTRHVPSRLTLAVTLPLASRAPPGEKSKEQLADQRWLGASGWPPLNPKQHIGQSTQGRSHTHTRRKLTRHKHTRHKYTCSINNGRVYSTDPGHGSDAGSQAPQARSAVYINIGRRVSASYHRRVIGPPPDAPTPASRDPSRPVRRAKPHIKKSSRPSTCLLGKARFFSPAIVSHPNCGPSLHTSPLESVHHCRGFFSHTLPSKCPF